MNEETTLEGVKWRFSEGEHDDADVRWLLAEVDRLNRWKEEAIPVMLGLQDLGRALGLPLGENITGPAAVEAATRLRAQVAAVEALMPYFSTMDYYGDEIVAQLEKAGLRKPVDDD